MGRENRLEVEEARQRELKYSVKSITIRKNPKLSVVLDEMKFTSQRIHYVIGAREDRGHRCMVEILSDFPSKTLSRG